ncbi:MULTISPECIES: glycosyltransferase family 2 protein [Fusobacterium]|jgi:glycosyltransferase involved in cell wall biosynthesis|uniref:glycosyltransferase family 2 protein n=1 Tax=Fusobacterium TaxID=848 RepID=UPI000E85A1DA|nr:MULTISPECIES: glycosyltransferase family 2 protein [Fusobacterium]HBJ79210.1 glycosyltransferase [Fusobacterium sp.]
MKKISIIVPCYNEEETIIIFYEAIIKVLENLKYEFEILFINDGSRDNSLELMKQLNYKDLRIQYLDLARNYGKEIAMAAGIDHITGDAMIIMDVDLQDPPELIPELIKYWEKGFDDIYAQRISRAGESFFKKFTSKLYYRVLSKISKVPIQIDTGDYRLISKKGIDALRELRESQRYTKGLFSIIGLKKKAILYNRNPRIAGKTKWNYLKLFGLAMEGIVSFTVLPLKLATISGIFISTLSFIYMFFIIFITMYYGIRTPGYSSLIVIILFLGGLQLLCLGIMGEYLGRIFYETKKRPLYFINEYSREKE